MNSNENISGRVVMVHPDLQNDPAEKIGKTGIIRIADIHLNDFFVDFADGKLGRYSADALLMLKPPEQIHHALENDRGTLSLSERKDLFNMTLLQTYGYPEQQHTALELAQKNPVLRELGLTTLEKGLGLSQVRTYGR